MPKNNSLNPTLIIVLLCLISSAGRLVIDSYLPSLPGIQYALALSESWTQMTLTVYLLGFGGSQLIYGPLSDYFGRRIILLLGMSIFFLGNIACSFADTGHELLIARFIAGAGAGSCGVLNRAIASDCFKGADFVKAWSYTTTTLVVTLILAPLIGGYIQEWEGWEGNFMFCAIFVGCVLALMFWILPETNTHIKQGTLHPQKIVMQYIKVLCSYHFIAPTLSYTLIFAGLIVYFQVSPLLLIENSGWSSVQYGWSSLVIAASYLLGGYIVRRWVGQVGIDKMLVLGLVLALLGGILSFVVLGFLEMKGIMIVLCSSVYVLGARMVIPNASALAMHSQTAPKGTVSALLGALQMLGAVLLGGFIAQFSTRTAFPLALFFIGTSGSALVLCYAGKWLDKRAII